MTTKSMQSPKNERPFVMRIHEKWYDVASFKHPGGDVALGLGRGRDATALFEAHHPFTSRSKLSSYLRKFEIPKDDPRLADPKKLLVDKREETMDLFEWDGEYPNGERCSQFGQELKQEVREYFQKEAKRRGISLLEATKATPWRWGEIIFFNLALLITIPFFVMGYYWTLILTPFLAWMAAANTSHDSMHFSVSTDWRVNALLGYICPWTASPLMWYHQHVIGHHAYPNIERKDPDLAHAPAIMRVHSSVPWKKAHVWQKITTVIVWTLGTTLYMTIVPLKAMAMGVLNRAVYLKQQPKRRTAQHVFGRVFTVALLWGWLWFVFPWWKAIIWAAVPMAVHSLCFMLATQINHLTPETAHESSKDYYKHQVITSHDFSTDNYFVFLLTGGLNLQIEHHLFPTVNHCHLLNLRPIIKRICDKHGVHYAWSPDLTVALTKYWEHITNMSVQPPKKIE
jgi:delta11-fatty-acid desaturase